MRKDIDWTEPDELLNTVASKPLLYTPGTNWNYAHTNYLILGLVLERLTGKRMSDLMQEKVLGPLGLRPAKVSFIMLTEAMIELARAGMGIGILPRWSAQRAIGSGAVVALSITKKGLRRRWMAGTLAAQPDPPALDDFIDLVADRALPTRTTARESA